MLNETLLQRLNSLTPTLSLVAIKTAIVNEEYSTAAELLKKYPHIATAGQDAIRNSMVKDLLMLCSSEFDDTSDEDLEDDEDDEDDPDGEEDEEDEDVDKDEDGTTDPNVFIPLDITEMTKNGVDITDFVAHGFKEQSIVLDTVVVSDNPNETDTTTPTLGAVKQEDADPLLGEQKIDKV